MANSIFSVCFLVLSLSGTLYANECYQSIFSFGDSIADTGNLKQLAALSDGDIQFICVSPYGQDFIGQSTGRCSNGRLIVDFLAESLGFPMLPPYLVNRIGGVVAERKGVNYAVVGATALDALISDCPEYNTSLRVQLSWFKQSLLSICGNTSDCRNYVGRSLILMGEIGGNDYNHPLQAGKTLEELEPYVPLVIDVIASTINDLIEMGAQTLVVPGNFPIGCLPTYLATNGLDNQEYDPITGCLTKFNEFAEYHNKMLQKVLNQIQERNPDVVIIYADYYNSLMELYRSPHKYGFTTDGTRKACCGCGGPFNCNMTVGRCGDACTTVCVEPDTYISWDGIHLTEMAYKLVFQRLFQGTYTTPQFYSLCPTSTSQPELSSSI